MFLRFDNLSHGGLLLVILLRLYSYDNLFNPTSL
jgi:hypothetical protein